ncbi:lipoprotein-anchoring transpeptidase ErfK/SrfK [Bradyrhizobium japonicum]|uniref:L,D-transpeptidase n=1 Tax=Bradyrhizobium TaxID=374 RepID=UPI0003F645DD|nr:MULTISPECIES: L,D-transpeptidase [Bradyrhizobium]MBR0877191.1 L,D-transpeptidase [Bradyrhizobium liaoningense]MBR0943459.1 L,D-transpeptidase [Bradyrhizobium liaoningense]MBR0997959.1 L,D-transpeptidase [Bradyrhizobium liaoningense]MBR1027230.1 L,D-transpeptidase [Bradyrhizobium liaoningense]MBR1063242.1 L,D-transpeptidase [Bradyrhizobium liaoningense]
MTRFSPVRRRFSLRATTAIAFATALLTVPFAAQAQTLGYAPMQPQGYPQDPSYSRGYVNAAPQAADEDAALPDRLRKQIVSFDRNEPAGTIVIDTGNTYLYYVLGNGRAIRYGVGVGRQGFTWAGVQSVSRKAEWPDWHPPAEMIARQPYLPRFVAGGPGNPLGARAMYLGSSEYRIHGTNDPTTIGKFVSSGCIRMTNEDVTDLFSRVNVGAKVVVLPKNAPLMARGYDKGGDPVRKRPPVTTLPSGRQALNITTSAVN